MNNIGGTSQFIAFCDECGDHSMTKVDADFPLFVLATVVIERDTYARLLIPALAAMKLRYWTHEGINLHSREIRKALGPFGFLQDKSKRSIFLRELTQIIQDTPFSLFVVGIRKRHHQERYGDCARNPYVLALEFTLERIAHFLHETGNVELPFVVEARGKNEDQDLEQVFHRVMTTGTYYRESSEFRSLNCPLVFRSKRDNIAGIQIADLCAYPAARHMLDPQQSNQAYDVASAHLYKHGTVTGWKVFP